VGTYRADRHKEINGDKAYDTKANKPDAQARHLGTALRKKARIISS